MSGIRQTLAQLKALRGTFAKLQAETMCDFRSRGVGGYVQRPTTFAWGSRRSRSSSVTAPWTMAQSVGVARHG